MFNITLREREVLRGLAGLVAEIAARDEEDVKRRLWYAHNDLEPTRPLVFCEPENGWNEIITGDSMQCEGELARNWEFRLRQEVFRGRHMDDDRVLEAYFDVPHVYEESDWGMRERRIGGEGGGAFTWEAPLKDYADLRLLRYPEITVDYKRTDDLVSLAREVFDGILTVRLKTGWYWSLGLTWQFVYLRGLEELLFDFYDYPDEVHKFMAVLRDGHLAKLDFLEEGGLLSPNNDGSYVGSGGFGWTRQLPEPAGKVGTKDMWGFAESQETVNVSPEMFAEFILPYQLPILGRFGLNCYGCCEALNARWEYIKNIPNLRRVSVAPWADVRDMAEKLQGDYVFSYKPNPAYIAVRNIDEDFIRSSLRDTVGMTKGCRLEIVLKDTNTIGGNPDNVINWCRIAKEAVEG